MQMAIYQPIKNCMSGVINAAGTGRQVLKM